MDQHGIKPERITKPIQLLAAWLVGLFVTNASFLLAAKQIDNPSWGAAMLLIASVVNVPVFIVALFLLQTKFRPQMQEDQYYSKYLDDERKSKGSKDPERDIEREIARTVERIVASIGAPAKGKEAPISDILHQTQVEMLAGKHGDTRALSQLYSSPSTWGEFSRSFRKSIAFRRELDGLVQDGLVVLQDQDTESAELTKLGESVAAFAKKSNSLFSQKNAALWRRMQSRLHGDIGSVSSE